jgi:hypothetical protein
MTPDTPAVCARRRAVLEEALAGFSPAQGFGKNMRPHRGHSARQPIVVIAPCRHDPYVPQPLPEGLAPEAD